MVSLIVHVSDGLQKNSKFVIWCSWHFVSDLETKFDKSSSAIFARNSFNSVSFDINTVVFSINELFEA